MATTLQDLLTRSQEVRDERQTAKNTATRVGQLFYDIVLFFNSLISGKQDKEDATLLTNDKTVTGAINEVLAAVGDGIKEITETIAATMTS